MTRNIWSTLQWLANEPLSDATYSRASSQKASKNLFAFCRLLIYYLQETKQESGRDVNQLNGMKRNGRSSTHKERVLYLLKAEKIQVEAYYVR